MISSHIRLLYERVEGQVEGQEPERAEANEQVDVQENNAEAEQELSCIHL